jgi:hypothetical protein
MHVHRRGGRHVVSAAVDPGGDEGGAPSLDGDWGDWVSATAVRNWLLEDPLIDWLDLYGPLRGYAPDQELGGYDPRMDFTKFVLDQGRRFEAAVLPVLASHGLEVVAVRGPDESSRDPLLAHRTVELLKEGVPAVWQGVLHDTESRTYGVPDLLVRSDVVNRIWPETIDDSEAFIPAPGLSATTHHYVVIDVKFTTLHLTAAGDLGNAGSHPLYKVQLAMMNRALSRIQGYDPPSAFIIGRGWEQKVKGVTTRARSCMDRLGRIDLSKDLPRRGPMLTAADEAAQWIREVRSQGASWEVLPMPTRPELYPNLGNDRDAPWHGAKRRIIEELEDLSVLWQVGPAGKRLGHEAGVFRWTDPACTAELLGLKGDRAAILDALLEINRNAEGPFAAPSQIPTDRETWHPTPALEFYVDFETVNDLADDFTSMPERGGQQLIFMVGCGHVEDGKWTFRTFTARHLTEEAEPRCSTDGSRTWLRSPLHSRPGRNLASCTGRLRRRQCSRARTTRPRSGTAATNGVSSTGTTSLDEWSALLRLSYGARWASG